MRKTLTCRTLLKYLALLYVISIANSYLIFSLMDFAGEGRRCTFADCMQMSDRIEKLEKALAQ